MGSAEQTRLRWLTVLILAIGALFITRLYFIQIVHGDEYQEEARNQYIATVPELYNRGSIYFREKEGKLVSGATVAGGYVIAINPKEVTDIEGTFTALSGLLPLTHEEYLEKVKKKDDPYEVLANRVSEESAKAIKGKKLDGVQVFRESWRYYPGGTLAAHVLGFVAYQGETLTGRYGVERYYNDTLTRVDRDLYANFFIELFSNLRETLFDRQEVEEGDVVLTIEPNVQSYVEGELQNVMKEWQSDQTGVIVMDPKSGKIIAMAATPGFDINKFNTVDNPRLYGNPMVENVYEMGSIVKPLTMAAGIDAGVVTAESTYDDVGHITLNKKTIYNFDKKARGPGTTMQDVLSKSLNTGVVYVVSKLGNERFTDYFLNKYHLGSETGIDLPSEVQGLTYNLDSKRDVEYATASFGQGIAITPINMTQALASLGNGGYLVSPHVVDEIQYRSGAVRELTPTPNVQILKESTSNEITRMLVEVVDTALLGGSVKIPEYSIAAKTGTAQMSRPRAEGGGYYDDRYMHTFFGYFPAYDPKFIVFYYTIYPKNAEYASHTLTYPFIRTAKFLLHYYGIPPDRDPTGKRLTP